MNVPSSETVETPFKPDYISLQKAAETGRDKKYKNKTSLEKAAFWNEVAQNAKESRQAVDKRQKKHVPISGAAEKRSGKFENLRQTRK